MEPSRGTRQRRQRRDEGSRKAGCGRTHARIDERGLETEHDLGTAAPATCAWTAPDLSATAPALDSTHTRPYDPRRPQVCLAETTVQLIGEKRIPVPMAPGRLARFDYEYERHG